MTVYYSELPKLWSFYIKVKVANDLIEERWEVEDVIQGEIEEKVGDILKSYIYVHTVI